MKPIGSGLAIIVASAIVVVAGITAYTVIDNRRLVEVEPTSLIQEIAEETVETSADKQIPEFDVVRVDETGSVVIAGHALPNETVGILLNGEILTEAQADAKGAFVALLDIEPDETARELSLIQTNDTGDVFTSEDKVLIMPFEPDADTKPKLVIAKPEGVKVAVANDVVETETDETVRAAVETDTEPLSLDTIVYDQLGDVVISGHANTDDYVRIYLDNEPAVIQKVPDTGQWEITLSDVPDGLYDLRVDSVDAAGAVTERVQSPFKRETPDVAQQIAQDQGPTVTIQPGYTLWALAENRYGSGVRYVQIYEANRGNIKDPDLIYPGQIFDIPK